MAQFNEAEAYEKHSQEQYKFGLDLIQRLNLKKGSKILDLGCGTGKLAFELASLVGPEGQVVAIDPNSDRLDIARDKYNAPNIVYVKADAENMPGEGYDVIFSNFVLHWVKNKDAVFQQAQRRLKKGGVLAFCCCIDPEDLSTIFPPGISDEFKKGFASGVFMVNDKAINHLATTYGFEADYLHEESTHFKFKDVYGIINGFLTHNPVKGFDTTHFDVEKLKEYYGDKFVITSQVLCAVYRKNLESGEN